MGELREYFLSHWRHKTNEANRGFFPTSLAIVEMEMKLIDFSEIEEGSKLNICDLSGGTGKQLYKMHDYLINKRLNPISYYNEVTKERYNLAFEEYGNKENFNLLNADFFNLKTRSQVNKKVFTIIRNNPPYGDMSHNGTNIRMEDLFFTRNAEMQVDYGIQIFELPMHQLIKEKNLIRKIFYRYENLHILKFPDEFFDKKQVCVIGTRKKVNSNDTKLAESWRERLKTNDILSLDEIDKPIIKLSKKAISSTKEIELFRDGKVSEETLNEGFEAVFNELLSETTSVNKGISSDLGLKIPPIEQLPGHIALEIYSGQFDGLLGNVLIKGGVKKGIKTVVEKQEKVDITTEIEIVYPFVEITSANGESLIKEHKFDDDIQEAS